MNLAKRRRLAEVTVGTIACLVVGCSGGASTGRDAGRDAGRAADDSGMGPDVDSALAAHCRQDEDCMGATGAAPCAITFCDRAFLQCTTTGPDNDADGHYDGSCDPGFGPGATRGDDCDDADPAAFGGRPEVCDPIGHDEDCDSTTVSGRADGDVDGDGSFAMTCCNRDAPTGETLCGADCDDLDGAVNPSAPDGPDIACDGIDNDCDLEVDEGCACRDGQTRRCGTDVGECLPGTEACVSGAWGMCAGGVDPTPEECDGDDDDCNMVVDDGCSCVDGASRSCGIDEGACAAGVQRCELGTWSSICEGAIGPTMEACDNDDDDCDGTIDNGCDCRDGDTRPCGTETGACVTGTERCMGGRWGACMGAVGPTAEDCDGGDEDCNGVDDNGCGCREGDTMPCGSDVGACVAGTIRCVGGAWTACTGGVGPSLEVCEGAQDENCDSFVDEGCTCVAGASRACGMGMIFGGTSRCVRGLETCAGGTWGACVGAVEPIGEQCGNTIDDDCDGMLNEECTDILQVAGGLNFTCALRRGGQVLCWGSNDVGQLGRGTWGPTTSSPVPAEVAGLTDAVEISLGYGHACARRASGTVMCWGENDSGQCGDLSASMTRSTPVAVTGLDSVVEIAVGGFFSAARRTDGSIWTWGRNSFGELGRSTSTTTAAVTPTAIPGFTALEIGLGDSHGCARRSGGSVWCWGNNEFGQLGDGTVIRHTAPAPVTSVADAVELAVATAGSHNCVRGTSGSVACWGYNDYGQIGDGTAASPRSLPTTVGGLTDPVSIALGTFHSCVVQRVGSMMCWGYNEFGQIGDGFTVTPRSTPRTVTGVGDAASAGLGGTHSCAVRASGRLVSCWGDNQSFQLGQPAPPLWVTAPATVMGLF